MYYAAIESNAQAKAKHNQSLRENAKARLQFLAGKKTVKREECAPNRKAKAALDARQKDHDLMTRRIDFKASIGAYHKPGSMNMH